MATYSRPQVELFETITVTPSEVLNPLRALIIGPNAQLHRYSVASEKVNINLGAYNPDADTCYNWPGRTPGSVVDLAYTKLFIDNALLQYLQDLIGSGSVIAPVAGHPNAIRSSTLAFKANGASYPRSGSLLDRDVQLGDTAHVRGTDNLDNDYELWTTVSGFDYETIAASVGPATADTSNPRSQAVAVTIKQTGGDRNGVVVIANALSYNGLPSGNINEVYTITVTQGSAHGDFTSARLQIMSASGTDNQNNVVPAAIGQPTSIGTRGLIIELGTSNTPANTSEALFEGVSLDDLLVDQTWQVTLSQNFTQAEADSGGIYSGPQNDTYVATVTKGGLWSQNPQITVTTAKGLDFSGPTTITSYDVVVPIGSQGVTISFFGAGSNSSIALGHTWNAPVPGLRLGDKFYIPVTAAARGRASTLYLANNLPVPLQTATDLELELYIESNIPVSQDRTGFAPVTNWQAAADQFCVTSGIEAYDASWTSGGVQEPLPVISGAMYLEYREWLPTLVNTVNALQDVADLPSLIPGPLDVDNPLSMAVSKALANSNGTIVRFIAVSDPTQLAAWQTALAAVKGRQDLYNYVPLTTDVPMLQLFQAQADDESGPTQSNPKAMFVQNTTPASVARVSQATSSDKYPVLATILANPNVTGTQYTLVTVPPPSGESTGNADFLTNGVQPGDTLYYNFTTDGFGNTTWSTATVGTVLSEESLLLTASLSAPINVAQKIEIWHTFNKNELAANLAVAAGSWGDTRVCAVWTDPGVLNVGGVALPGYMMCAALAGYVSGVAPHQSLTNADISGFAVGPITPYFNSDQLDTIAGGGTWIVTQNPDGSIITRDALTTNMADIPHRLEMFRRNLDSQAIMFVGDIRTYIGKMNVVPSALLVLRQVVNNRILFFKSNRYTPELGAQLVDGNIVSLEQNILLADAVDCVVSLLEPVTMDKINLYLQASVS